MFKAASIKPIGIDIEGVKVSIKSTLKPSSVSPIGPPETIQTKVEKKLSNSKLSTIFPIDSDSASKYVDTGKVQIHKNGKQSPQSVVIEDDIVGKIDQKSTDMLRNATFSTKISEEAACRKALSRAEKNFGYEHHETIDCVCVLANVLAAVGKPLEAENLYNRALQWKENHLGEEHYDTVSVLHALGDLQIRCKKFDSAALNLERALKFREASLGLEHFGTIKILESLARLKALTGSFTEAEDVYQRLLRWKKSQLGPEALPTLDTIEDLARVMQNAKRYQDAEIYYQKVLNGRVKVLGNTSTSALVTKCRLATLHAEMGKTTESSALFSRAILELEEALGCEHVLTLNAVHDFAGVLVENGDLQQAVAMYTRAVDGRERVLGEGHHATKDSAEKLAALFERIAEASESPRPLQDSASKTIMKSQSQTLQSIPSRSSSPKNMQLVVRDLIGSKSRSKLLSSNSSADLLAIGWKPFYHESRLVGAAYPVLSFETDGIANAEKVFRAAYDRHVQSGDDNDNRFLVVVSKLAAVMHLQKKLRDAEALYRKAIQIHDILHCDDDYETLEIMRGFSALLLQRRMMSEAIGVLNRLVKGCNALYGPGHTDTLFAINVLAGVMRRESRFDDAATEYAAVLEGYERSLGPDHPFSLTAANDLAVQLCRLGMYDQAEEHLEDILVGREKALGMDHVDTLAVVNNLALVLQLQNKVDRVEELYTRAIAGLDRELSERTNELFIGMTYNYAFFCHTQGQSEKCIALLKTATDYSQRTAPKYRLAIVVNVVMQLLSIYKSLRMTNEADEMKAIVQGVASLPVRSEFDDEDEKVVKEDSSSLENLPPFPKKGVKLRLLQRMRELSQPTWTTTDVNLKLVMPWTEELKCSFADLMEMKYSVEPHPELGLTYDECFTSNASVFVSHAWRYEFSCLVEAIEQFFVDELVVTGEHAGCSQSHRILAVNTSLWVDLFVNDQWNAPSLPYEWWSGTFLSAIGDIGHTMLVLSPWDAPIPLTRAWCLWEILSTIRTGSKLTVQLSAKHRRQFQSEYRKDENCLFSAFCKIDVQNSEAYKVEDRDMIFAAVKNTVENGFRGVNNLIMGHLRAWVKSCIQEMVDDPFQSLDPNAEKPAEADERWTAVRNKVLLAGLCHTQFNMIEAAQLYNESIMEMKELTHRDDPELLRTKARLAALYRCSRMYKYASVIYADIYESFRDTLGRDAPDTLRILAYQAKVYQLTGELDDALALYSTILEKFRKVLPVDHRDTLQTMQNIGQIYADKGLYDDALSIFTDALSGYERSPEFGSDHPDTLRTVHCIGIVLQNLKNFIEADEHYTRAHIGLERVLGPKHPDVIQVASNAAALRSYFFKNPFTNFCQKAVQNA